MDVACPGCVKGFFLEDMWKLKEDALLKGELTDFSFLAGDGEAAEVWSSSILKNCLNLVLQLVHCFKSDLLVASEYFRALLRNPLENSTPVIIKHIKPHIFKLVIRYCLYPLHISL
jgi:hypothetical protein